MFTYLLLRWVNFQKTCLLFFYHNCLTQRWPNGQKGRFKRNQLSVCLACFSVCLCIPIYYLSAFLHVRSLSIYLTIYLICPLGLSVFACVFFSWKKTEKGKTDSAVEYMYCVVFRREFCFCFRFFGCSKSQQQNWDLYSHTTIERRHKLKNFHVNLLPDNVYWIVHAVYLCPMST